MANEQDVFRRSLSSSAPQSGDIPVRSYRPVVAPPKKRDDDPLVGALVADRYRVISVVSRGGMGVIYKCKQEILDRIVALKLLPFEMVEDEVVLDRFQREAKVLSRLNHPNLTTLYDFGRLQTGEPYFVLEFVAGQTVEAILQREDHLDYRRAVPIFLQICSALGYAHNLGVIHRDMKPANVMLVDGPKGPDVVKILDFGIVKLTDESRRLTRMGEVWGTAIYMSPEQCTGQQVDARSDIFSVGSVLYECLTGKHPFNGKNLMEIMTKLMTETQLPFGKVRPDLAIPQAVEMVAARAMRKEPAERFESMEQLAAALQDALKAPLAPQVQTGSSVESIADSQRFSHKISAADLGIQSRSTQPASSPDQAPQTTARPVEGLPQGSGAPADQKVRSPEPNGDKPGRRSDFAPSGQPVTERWQDTDRSRRQARPPEAVPQPVRSPSRPAADASSRAGERPTGAMKQTSFLKYDRAPGSHAKPSGPARMVLIMVSLAVAAFVAITCVWSALHHAQQQPPGEPQPGKPQIKHEQNKHQLRKSALPDRPDQLPHNAGESTGSDRLESGRPASQGKTAITGPSPGSSTPVANGKMAAKGSQTAHRHRTPAVESARGRPTGHLAIDVQPVGNEPDVVQDAQSQWWRFKQRQDAAIQQPTR